ncbi:hypothetical protein, partial [Enterobacter cloacae]|uniref:hypothetical protein n=1 Tax=Enterobacter cloacae TaxID=550 RepID=UPI001E597657
MDIFRPCNIAGGIFKVQRPFCIVAKRKIGNMTFRYVGVGPCATINNVVAAVIFKTVISATTAEIIVGTVAKLAMRQPFVLFKGLTFQKLCLPGAFRPGDHHN